jgi:hypothetical protein
LTAQHGALIDTLHAYAPMLLGGIRCRSAKNGLILCIYVMDRRIPTDKESLAFVEREARDYVGEGAIDISAYIKKNACNIRFL